MNSFRNACNVPLILKLNVRIDLIEAGERLQEKHEVLMVNEVHLLYVVKKNANDYRYFRT